MIITTVIFITLLVNWHNNRLLPLIRQFFLTLNRINEFMDLRLMFHLLLESFLWQFDHYWAIYTFSNRNFNFESTRLK
jgi:hypothetical protein